MRSISIKSLAYACSPSAVHPFLKRIEASDVGARLARGVFWSVAGAVMSRGLMLCATVLVARILGKTVYGELGMIQSTVGMFGVFAGFGLGLTANKHAAEFRLSDPERAGRIIGLSGLFAMLTGALMASGLFIFAPWLAERTINAPHLAGILRISALVLFINTLNGAQIGALSGFEAFRAIARVNLFVGLISFPILVFGAYVGGLKGAVWALAINLCFNWLLNHLALRKETRRWKVPFSIRNCTRDLSVLWTFSLPAALSSVLVGPVNWACGALLVNQPGGYSEMAVYSAANQWFAVLMFLPGMFARVALPVLSNQLGQNNRKNSIETLTFSIKTNLVIVAPLIVIASILSSYLMSLYGEGFRSGWPTMVIALITAGLLSVQTPVGQIIAASGRMWIGFLMNLGWAMTFIITTFCLIDHGSLGLASARMLSYVAHTLWVSVFAINLIRRSTPLGEKVDE